MMNSITKELDDKEVITRILQGEKVLYEILVRRYNPDLFKVGRTYGYNHDDTEDLMQDTYIDAFRNLSGFEFKSSFKTWLVRLMLNNCYKRKEKYSFKNELAKAEMNENAQPVFERANQDVLLQIKRKELHHELAKALHNIPEDYRIVFSMREMNQFSVEETAHLLGISESNVKVRLNRAKSMLQNQLLKSHDFKELYGFHAIHCDPFTAKLMEKTMKL
ncbi:MAG: sigma-70 family RNA polymerase sigma factor [Bacteroidia bacterium]|nr:sigma-70 family RNA polymerase sigma factor [Bacteroidia bacterium]